MAKQTQKKPDPQDVINSAGSAASGVPKPIIDAGTKPRPPKPPKDGNKTATSNLPGNF